jgi:AbrB family looped-hinge helix DNA binding protein
MMSLVKVIKHGQVAIPANFREKLNIKEGDYLEAELDGKTIILRPKMFIDRKDTLKALHEMMNEVHEKTKNLNHEEIDEIIDQAIVESRQIRAKKAQINENIAEV